MSLFPAPGLLEREYLTYQFLARFTDLSAGPNTTLFFNDDEDLMIVLQPGVFANTDNVFIVDLRSQTIIYQAPNSWTTPHYQPNITAGQASVMGRYAVFVDNAARQVVVLRDRQEKARLDIPGDITLSTRSTTFISPKGKYVALAQQGTPQNPRGDVLVWKGL